MSKTEKFLGLGILIAIVIAVGAYFFPQIHKSLGAVSTSCSSFTSCLSDLYLTTTFGGTGSIQTDGTVKVSSTGTALNRLNAGSCFIQPYATTIAASTTVAVDCQGTAAVGSTSSVLFNDSALAGVTTGDNVQVSFSTSTKLTSGGLAVEGVAASTTPGWIQVLLANFTGTTYTWPMTGTASGTMSYFVSH